MKQYLELLRTAMFTGEEKADRTRTGTLSIFGAQMRFDLREGFPLVTTKRMFTPGVVHELLWFLSGSTSIDDLPDNVRHWWSPWVREDNSLGPIYGEQYRKSRWWYSVKPELFDPPNVDRVDGGFCGVGDLGSWRYLRGQGREIEILRNTWRDMLKRCYDVNSKGYPAYGGSGVHVAPEWMKFDNFAEDAVRLPGWHMKLEYPDEYSIDKDILAASNRYSKSTCMWASHEEQGWNTSTGTPFFATSPDGVEELFPSIGDIERRYGLNISAVHRCLNGKLKSHHGWSGFRYASANGEVLRFRQCDQVKQVIASIKHDPDSRRHIINLWHTPSMVHASLPCCHGSIIQFYVCNGRLSCQMYQRSADLFLGVPVNIASYALLTHMVAQVCDLEVGEFIWTGGDCHIYLNHVDQVLTQIERGPYNHPQLLLDRSIKDIDDFRAEHITLVNYLHHPAIKGEVAV